MKYDYDNLHTEIDNAAAELGLDPWQALEVWHIGVEAWASGVVEPTIQADAVNCALPCPEEGNKECGPNCIDYCVNRTA